MFSLAGNLLSGVLALVGVALGVGLQFVVGRSLETGRQLKVQKGQAYADYFKAFALAATSGRSAEVDGLAADAKTRICIYGSPAVVKRLSEFEELGAVLDSEASRAAIAGLLHEMRTDMNGAAPQVDDDALRWALFGRSRR